MHTSIQKLVYIYNELPQVLTNDVAICGDNYTKVRYT